MIEIRGEIYQRYEACAEDRRKKTPARKRVIGRAYYIARNYDEACEMAQRKLRDAGVKGRHYITVRPYYPWLDSAFHGYIREVSQARANHCKK